MQRHFTATLLLAVALLIPVTAIAQSGGGAAGGGSAGGASAGTGSTGAATGPSVGIGSAIGSPTAGSAGAGTQGVNGVPSGPANAGGINSSVEDPSGAGNSAKVPTAPATNSLGTANSTGAREAATNGNTTGMAGNRSLSGNSGRIDGTATPGPSMPGDAEIRAEDPKVDAKIKSICKGC